MRAIKVLSILLATTIVFSMINCVPIPATQPIMLTPTLRHTYEQIQGVESAWSVDNVYVIQNNFDITLSAGNHQLCFIGGQNVANAKYLSCLDGDTGEFLWRKESGIYRSLEVMPDGVFVIYSSSAEVKKHDSQTGDVVWSNFLHGSGSYFFYVVDNQLQVSISPTKLWIIDFDGNTLKELDNHTTTFISTPDETFIRLNGLASTITASGEIKWMFRDMDYITNFTPVFTDDKVFVRTGLQLGDVYALDRKTGKLFWKTGDVISNVVYSTRRQLIYVLREDGKLLSIDEKTAEEKVVVAFSSVPFILSDEENVGAYQLAYDPSTYTFFVSLGDSRQLFAFKEQ